jgi:hypothetical protein
VNAVHHAYLIKGFLLAKEAPLAIMESVEAIIERLDGGELTITSTFAPELTLPIPLRSSEETVPTEASEPASGTHEQVAGENSGNPPAQPKQSRRSSSVGTEQADGVRQMVTEGKSDEEISERLGCSVAELKVFRRDQGIARPKGNPNFRKAKSDHAGSQKSPAAPSAFPEIGRVGAPEPAPAQKTKPIPPIDTDRLLTIHNGYAGKRDPGQALTDQDWPDIKARLAKSPDRRAIASDYDVDLEDLNFFIASCQRREGKSPGEAIASPSGGASDAARPKW